MGITGAFACGLEVGGVEVGDLEVGRLEVGGVEVGGLTVGDLAGDGGRVTGVFDGGAMARRADSIRLRCSAACRARFASAAARACAARLAWGLDNLVGAGLAGVGCALRELRRTCASRLRISRIRSASF